MKKTGIVIYIAVGILLLAAVILTGSRGLSSKNIDIYRKAAALQGEMEELGFPQFQLADYPVAFFDGDYDYVVTANGEDINIRRREPVLNTFVGTAFPVEDHYEVLVPAIEKFQDMFSALSSAQKLGEFSQGEIPAMDEMEYDTIEQVATIWHEAFHAYQFTYYPEQETDLMQGHDFTTGDWEDGETLIVEQIDSNPEVSALWKRQMQLLELAVQCEDVDTLRNYILEYKALDTERRELLGESVLALEEYYIQLEGTARYVESQAYRKLNSEEAFHSVYVETIRDYTGGSNKYYDIGMAECLILDKVKPGWQAEYDSSVHLLELICQALEI